MGNVLPGGAKRARTADPLLAKQVLYQLSYSPQVASGIEYPLREAAGYSGLRWLPDREAVAFRIGDGGYQAPRLVLRLPSLATCFTYPCQRGDDVGHPATVGVVSCSRTRCPSTLP